MPKSVSAPAILRRAIAIGAIPSDAVIKKAEVTWERDGLRHLGWVSKKPTGELSWNLNVGDAKFGPKLDGYGGFAVMVRADDNAMPWPERVSDELDEFLRHGFGTAALVVADRLDLAELLAASGDVHRGSVFIWLPEASYPSRLVLAKVLAEDLGRDDLAREYRERLESAPEIPASAGRVINPVSSARTWAKTYGKRLGFEIKI